MLRLEVATDRGSVDVRLTEGADGEALLNSEALADGVYTIEIPETGAYELRVTGDHAAGSFSLEKAESR